MEKDRALCATEKLLLLDEPVAGLDPVMTADLYQLVAKLNQTHWSQRGSHQSTDVCHFFSHRTT